MVTYTSSLYFNKNLINILTKREKILSYRKREALHTAVRNITI